MSNIGSSGGGGSKNGPWSRAPAVPNNMQQQLLPQGAAGGLNNMNSMNNINSNIVPFQQQQVFQNMGMQQQNLSLGLQQLPNPAVSLAGGQLNNQLFQHVGAVTYPNPRALNPAAFSAQTQPPKVANVAAGTGNQPNATEKVFIGTVTTVHDNFGFVDEDVFFPCIKGSSPKVGDRVLVEALYNPRMPFKWNATKIQVLPMSGGSVSSIPNVNNRPGKNYNSQIVNNYNAVPPPAADGNNGGFNRRSKGSLGGRGRERSRDRDRDDEEIERKRRREERMREREKEEKKSPLRRRSRSPKSRRRSRIVPRYVVQIPKIALDMAQSDVLEVRRRYNNLYIPSDFFNSNFRWLDAFPADKPFTLNKPCLFHIMNKDVDAVSENAAVLEPPDADYLFSAKVMLMSVPGMEEMYQKCCAMAEDKDRRERDSEERDYVHPTRLINFLVGLRGKNETMAIGGPWSPSLDGENPSKDPSVLIRTAIRTCRALTGIDLSNCTKWYRFVELYYRRGDSGSSKGGSKQMPSVSGVPRVETVVLFLPDIWSCLPTQLEWDALQVGYCRQLERKLKAGTGQLDQEAEEQQASARGASAGDEKEEDTAATDKLEPTHYSQLDPKTMSLNDLRKELAARSLNTSGLKSQLVAKLAKALKSEIAKTEDGKEDSDNNDIENEKKEKGNKDVAEEKKIDDKERLLLEKKYSLPEAQHILVHPSRVAKSGKFDCTVMSLSLLLDYRPEDTKEHSFEVSLFAELFNEMLMRDFGFSIYRALHDLPDKPKEKEKDDKDKKRDKDKDDKDKKDNKDTIGKRDREKKDSNKSEQDSDEEDFDEDDDNKSRRDSKDKRKRERPKLYTKDRHLLLSFVYFDQTHCGYIFEKDIEDLLYTLGLNLSRAQVRKLVGKVITRDSLHYRKLTDKAKEEDFIVIDDSEKDSNLDELAAGNKKLLKVFVPENEIETHKSKIDSDGFVMFRGALVDVAKLFEQLERSEKARLDTEARMIEMKAENNKLSDKYLRSNGTVKNLTVDLKDYKEKLKVTEDSLHRITACSKLFQTTLQDIKEKIEPVLSSTKEDKEKEDWKASRGDKDRDRNKDESKSRWEKDGGAHSISIKQETKTTQKEKDITAVKIMKEAFPAEGSQKEENLELADKEEDDDMIGFKPEVIDEVGDVEMEPEVVADGDIQVKTE